MESSYIIDELYIYHFMDLNLISNVGNLNNYNLKLLLNYLFNNLTITLFIIFAFMLLYNNIFFLQNFIIKIKIQLIISSLINFIKNLFNDLITTNIAKFYYFQLLFLLFLLLLVINLFGLLPYTFVLTAQFCFTFSCAFIYFFSLNVTGIYLHGIKILNLFFPSGAPIFIAPLLVIIEIISYFARVFSLSIRLFANITAGHILLKIIAWFIWSLYNYIFASIPGIIIICILWFLEFFISILQAYVFTILLCIYLTDVINLH
jgi:F-type H+-transporting ATPase subunit a